MGFVQGVPYFVESDGDDTVLIALDPKLNGRYVEWFDTLRDRMFEVVKMNDDGDAVTVDTPRAAYTFKPLTLELYDRFVKRVVDGQPAFYSTEQVRSFYQGFPR